MCATVYTQARKPVGVPSDFPIFMTAIRTPKGLILWTEDDPDSRELIVWILETADYHVTITADSAETLSLGQREQFDLILVDNWMPGLLGRN